MDQIAQSWRQVTDWLSENAPAIYSVQNGAAAATTIKRACKGLNLRPPEDYQGWILNTADGQKMNNVRYGGVVPSKDANSVIGICHIVGAGTTTKILRDFYAKKRLSPKYAGPMHNCIWHDSWFAFAWDNTNEDGICLAFEMNPPSDGTPGQIIFISDKPAVRTVLCSSFTEFIQQLGAAYANNEYVYNESKNTIARKNVESFPLFAPVS